MIFPVHRILRTSSPLTEGNIHCEGRTLDPSNQSILSSTYYCYSGSSSSLSSEEERSVPGEVYYRVQDTAEPGGWGQDQGTQTDEEDILDTQRSPSNSFRIDKDQHFPNKPRTKMKYLQNF